jgi:hypothetical protein
MAASTSSRARLFHICDEIEGVAITVRGFPSKDINSYGE